MNQTTPEKTRTKTQRTWWPNSGDPVRPACIRRPEAQHTHTSLAQRSCVHFLLLHKMNLLHPDGWGVTVSSACASLILSDSRACIFLRLFSNSFKYCTCFSKSTLSSLYIPMKTFSSWHLSSILKLCFKAALNFSQITWDEYGSGTLDALVLFRSNSSSCKSWDNSCMRSRQHSLSSSQNSLTLSFFSSGSPKDSVGISVISGNDIPIKWDDSPISEPVFCVSSCKRFSSWLVWLWLVLAWLDTWLSVWLVMSWVC